MNFPLLYQESIDSKYWDCRFPTKLSEENSQLSKPTYAKRKERNRTIQVEYKL